MDLVRSKQRVKDHGEVFTPSWLVEAMLDSVKHESQRIDSRFLEPACGSGNFLVPVLQRKLATVDVQYGKNEFEKRHHALLALMCIYGIEILEDNAQECRVNLFGTFAGYLGVEVGDKWSGAAKNVLALNIVQGDALTMTTPDNQPLTFPEWGYLTKGKFQRRDFQFDMLTERSATNQSDMLWQHFTETELFAPVKSYNPMTVDEVAR
jgi:hypothetical protein